MPLDQPQAKFRLKSDLNCLLIDFFDPIPAAGFTSCDDLIRIQTIIRLKSLILDRFKLKWSILIEILSFSSIYDIH